MLYNKDISPGLAQRDAHEYQDNQQVHIQIPVDEIVSVPQIFKPLESLDVSQNFPNPATGIASIMVKTSAPSQLSLTVRNMTGQMVHSAPAKNVFAGTHLLKIDVDTFTPGVYFYTVDDGNQSVTKKMIVK